MTASDASTISSRLGTESCDSTLAMTSMTCAPGVGYRRHPLYYASVSI